MTNREFILAIMKSPLDDDFKADIIESFSATSSFEKLLKELKDKLSKYDKVCKTCGDLL